MKNVIKSIVLILFVSIMLCGCGSKKEYIKDISLKEFKQMISDKKTFALYVGNDGCSHCVAYKPTLLKVLKKYNITIYHIDNSKLTTEEKNEFTTYINITGTPTIAFITKGEEETTLNRISGEVSEEETIERFKTNGYIK